ncbi:MAG: glycosyltransferase [Alphaproteobacteria bacterium]|nr:glycosyltransferase [Alphaproteobacteria bacterium]
MANITIIMPSYNRGEYIAEALDSVFMQETNYDYQIIVADDCSTDKSVEIVKQYQKKYPNKIILLTSEKNQKLYRNILRAYEITKTDYFCVLDPDDFWIDKHKIQRALDFLEKNKEFTIYSTDTDILTPDGKRKRYLGAEQSTDSDFNDYLNNKAVLGHTTGSIFRNVIFKNGIPEKMKNLECSSQEVSFRGDSFRNIIHLHEGKAHCVPDVDGVYRITNNGIWQSLSELEQNLQNAVMFKDFWLYFDKKYPELLVHSYGCISKEAGVSLKIKNLELKTKKYRKLFKVTLVSFLILLITNIVLCRPFENVRLRMDYRKSNPVCYETLNTDSERKCLYKYLKNSHKYLEFGSGGSTFDAIKLMKGENKVIYSVEGSEEWCEHLKKWELIRDSIKTGKLRLMYMNIGLTGNWSVPVEKDMKGLFRNYYSVFDTPIAKKVDTILIDGRFRVICALKAIKNCRPDVFILIHDFSIRPKYHIILKYLDEIERVDTLSVFSIKKNINTEELDRDIEKYKYIED